MGSLNGKTFIYDLRFFNGMESTYLPTRSYSYSLLLELLLVTSSWRQEYEYELDFRCVDQKKKYKKGLTPLFSIKNNLYLLPQTT